VARAGSKAADSDSEDSSPRRPAAASSSRQQAASAASKAETAASSGDESEAPAKVGFLRVGTGKKGVAKDRTSKQETSDSTVRCIVGSRHMAIPHTFALQTLGRLSPLSPETETGAKYCGAATFVVGSLAKKDPLVMLLLGRGTSADNERFAEILGEMELPPVEKLHGKDDEIMDSVSYVFQANPKLSQAYDLYVPHLASLSVTASLRLASVKQSPPPPASPLQVHHEDGQREPSQR